MDEKMKQKTEEESKGVKSKRREEKTCKPKADSNKLIMQRKMQTFMDS